MAPLLVSFILAFALFSAKVDASLPSFLRRSLLGFRCGGEDNVTSSNSSSETFNSTNATLSSATPTSMPHEILEEEVVFSRWRSVTRRLVRMRNGRIVDFDIIGQRGGTGAVLVFAWDRQTKTATLVREYMPGCHRILNGLAAGVIENDKHGSDPLLAGQHELEEECHLAGGEWIYLGKACMDKYSSTIIHAYLVLDPYIVANPRPLDEDEDIEIIRGVTIDEILTLVQKGEMNIVGGWGALLAIEMLRELGEVV